MDIHIKDASPGWGLIMQSGARMPCEVNVPLKELLLRGLDVPAEKLQRVDVLLLDGKPVDQPDKTPVPDGARVALAAGLPGIAGLAMKSGSAVRGLRPGITHREGQTALEAARAPGSVELALFSLALPLLAMHFLRRGVTVSAEKLLRCALLAGGGKCFCDGREISREGLEQLLRGLPGDAPLRFSAAPPVPD